jgi:hypothetical protein
MRITVKASASLVIGLLWVGSVLPVRATTIYDNSINDLVHRFNPSTVEVGDEILLASTERYLTNFSFEFWGENAVHSNSFSGTITARVRFYENNGTPFNGYATPGTTPFYDSGWFSVPSPTDRNTFVFTAGSDFPSWGLFLPTSDMTWSVQFQGMGAGDSVGLDIYSPPVVGQSYPDYWENNGGWVLLTNGVPMDFASKMEAMVPEPSAMALSCIGGLVMLVLSRRLRQKN